MHSMPFREAGLNADPAVCGPHRGRAAHAHRFLFAAMSQTVRARRPRRTAPPAALIAVRTGFGGDGCLTQEGPRAPCARGPPRSLLEGVPYRTRTLRVSAVPRCAASWPTWNRSV